MDYQPVEEAPATVTEQDSSLTSQVQALTDEVEMLREEEAARERSRPLAATARAADQEKRVTTILVYRDGHQSEVQNYAILGHTLWVFAAQTTRKVPLADLDLDVTRKLNDDRGVEFVSEGSL